jgi:hypothetical protein
LPRSWARAQGWAYLLPPLLGIDNVLVPGWDPARFAALSSSLMAALGFACDAIARRRGDNLFPAAERLNFLLTVGRLLLAIGA